MDFSYYYFLRFQFSFCLLYTSDAADDMQCVDLGGRRIIKKLSLIAVWRVFFQAEDGIRDVERSRGLGDVYKRQPVFFFLRRILDGFFLLLFPTISVFFRVLFLLFPFEIFSYDADVPCKFNFGTRSCFSSLF